MSDLDPPHIQGAHTAAPSDRVSTATVRQKAVNLFSLGRNEFFEDGFESEFSKGILSLISNYGDDGVARISAEVLNDNVNEEVASEALRWLGRVNARYSYRYRFWLLRKALTNESPKLRDGAILGLASLDDPDAIPDLDLALEAETFVPLQNSIRKLITQLMDSA